MDGVRYESLEAIALTWPAATSSGEPFKSERMCCANSCWQHHNATQRNASDEAANVRFCSASQHARPYARTHTRMHARARTHLRQKARQLGAQAHNGIFREGLLGGQTAAVSAVLLQRRQQADDLPEARFDAASAEPSPDGLGRGWDKGRDEWTITRVVLQDTNDADRPARDNAAAQTLHVPTATPRKHRRTPTKPRTAAAAAAATTTTTTTTPTCLQDHVDGDTSLPEVFGAAVAGGLARQQDHELLGA